MKKMMFVLVMCAGAVSFADTLLTRENCAKIHKAQMQPIVGDQDSPENLQRREVNEQLSKLQTECHQKFPAGPVR